MNKTCNQRAQLYLRPLIFASMCVAFSGASAQDDRTEIDARRHFQSLEAQQAQYRRKLEALEDLSSAERQRLDRQFQRQRFKQQLLDNRLLHRHLYSPRLPAQPMTPASRLPQSLQPQRSQELQFKIERESWRYPAGPD